MVVLTCLTYQRTVVGRAGRAPFRAFEWSSTVHVIRADKVGVHHARGRALGCQIASHITVGRHDLRRRRWHELATAGPDGVVGVTEAAVVGACPVSWLGLLEDEIPACRASSSNRKLSDSPSVDEGRQL